MRLSLQARILLLIAGTVTGLAAIVLLALTLLTNREIDRSIRTDVSTTGIVLADFVSERTLRLSDLSLLLARQPILRATIGRGDVPTVTDAARDCRQQIHADAVLITDRDGRVLAETDTRVDGTGARAEEPGVQKALQGETWSGVVAHGKRLMLAVSVPVKTNDVILGSFTAYSA